MGTESFSHKEAIADAQDALEMEAAGGVAVTRRSSSSSPHISGGATSAYGVYVAFREEGSLKWQEKVKAIRDITLISTAHPRISFIVGTTHTGEQILLTSRRIMGVRRNVAGMLGDDLLSKTVVQELFDQFSRPLKRRDTIMQGAKASNR
jgi:hypothetical protein